MRAKNLIAGAAFDPATVKAMGEAFDQAWIVIAPKFGSELPLIVENARFWAGAVRHRGRRHAWR